MSEEQGHEVPQSVAQGERTGHPVVDDVLESISRLDDLPVAEQVPVFESAHERLRSALADAGNEQTA